MKCERCNTNIKKGELFCSKCGVKIKDNDINNTKTIQLEKISKEKDIKDDVKDLFYQPGMEVGNTNPVNIFLILLVLLLIGGIVYLIFFDTYIIKRESNTKVVEVLESNTIYYNNIYLDINNNIEIKYVNDRLNLSKKGMKSSLYMISDKYDDIINDIDEIILKWNEMGVEIKEKAFLNDHIYKLSGNYMFNDYIIYIMKLNETTIIMESSFDTIDIYNNEYKSLEEILLNIKMVPLTDLVSPLAYPEFNLEPIGSQ